MAVNPLLAVASTFIAGELLIPFTVLVNAPPEMESAFELIIGTVAPVIPFTDVVSVLAAEVLDTALTLFAAAETPFTTLVKVLPDKLSVCVVVGTMPAKLMAGLLTPFTVVVRLLPDKALLMELMMGTAVPVTPFTVVVKLLIAEVLETEFTMGTAVPVIPFTVVLKLLGAVLVLLTVVFAGAAAAGSQLEVVLL